MKVLIMKNLFKYRDNAAWFRAAIAVLPALLLNGCQQKDVFYQDVQHNRSAAFNEWNHIQKQQDEPATQISGQLNLQDALKLAMLNNNELLAVVQQREVARGKIIESYSAILPTVSVQSGYTRKDEPSRMVIGNSSIDMGEPDNYSAGLVVRQPIYRGGAISAALRAAQIYSLHSDEQVRGQLQMTMYNVASAYFDTLLAQQLYQVNLDAVKSAETQLSEIKAKRAQGVASEYDVLRAEVDVSNFRAEMIQQKNRISVSKSRLMKAMGVTSGQELMLADTLQYEKVDLKLDDAVRTAYENRADLYLAEYDLRLQKESVTIAKSEYWPQMYGTFSQGWSRPDPHAPTLDRWDDYWVAGISLEWPLFSGMGREGRIIQQQALVRQKQYLLKNTEQKAFLEVQQALLTLQDANEFVESQKLNLQRANEGSRLAEVGYREGVSTLVELTDARSALTRASGFYFQSLYQHTMARLNLQLAMGILGPKAGQKQDAANIVKPGNLGPSLAAIQSQATSDPNGL